MSRGSWVVGHGSDIHHVYTSYNTYFWVRLNWVGGWVVGHICLKIKKDILVPSVHGPNLQLPTHKLISPNFFYETLNK